jgi:hypothetical protein
MTNIQAAEKYAAEHTEIPNGHASGWFGEDSDFVGRFLRFGSNAVVVESPWGLMVERWHDVVVVTRGYKYPAR